VQYDGDTALHMAVCNNKALAVAEFLISSGANTAIRNVKGQTAMDINGGFFSTRAAAAEAAPERVAAAKEAQRVAAAKAAAEGAAAAKEAQRAAAAKAAAERAAAAKEAQRAAAATAAAEGAAAAKEAQRAAAAKTVPEEAAAAEEAQETKAVQEASVETQKAAWHQLGLNLPADRIIDIDSSALGQGSFAVVHRGRYQMSRTSTLEVAFKIFHGGVLNADILKQVNNEVKVTQKLRHPNLVQHFGLCELPTRGLSLVMELAQGGCLHNVLIDRAQYPELPWPILVRWMLQASEGMKELHSMFPPIVHRDLKAANVLLSSNNIGDAVAKIADFGCAKIVTTLRSTFTGRTGTLAFNSPETFIGKYSEASDAYAFGMFGYEVVARQTPFQGLSEAEIIEQVRIRFDEEDSAVKRLQEKYGESIEEQRQEWIQDHPLSNRRPDLSLTEQGCPDVLLHLIERCWADDAGDRPTFAECCNVLEAIGSHEVRLVKCLPDSLPFLSAAALLEDTWTKREMYQLGQVVAVYQVQNSRLTSRYEAYKAKISVDGVVNGNETLVFHGCPDAAMDPANADSIVQTGFRKEYWRSSAGDWQRFGPGFYFGQQASKSHEYPLPEMKLVGHGENIRRMLVCRVARGKIFKTDTNMSYLQGAAPEGYDSVHGEATKGGPLNFDELVVYHEAAVVPYLIAEYTYTAQMDAFRG